MRTTTNWVLRLQKPTFPIASEIVLSFASMIASTVRVPPTAFRSFETAASVTSSFVCDDSMSETSVANRLFYDKVSMPTRNGEFVKYFGILLLKMSLVTPHRVYRSHSAGTHFFDNVVRFTPLWWARMWLL